MSLVCPSGACGYGDHEFTSEAGLRAHMKHVHGEGFPPGVLPEPEPAKAPLPGVRSIDTTVAGSIAAGLTRPRSPKATFGCPECGDYFKSAAGLGSHRRNHGVQGRRSSPAPVVEVSAEKIAAVFDVPVAMIDEVGVSLSLRPAQLDRLIEAGWDEVKRLALDPGDPDELVAAVRLLVQLEVAKR